jgi:outer membrane porin, OprD family
MKKTAVILSVAMAMTASLASAESVMKPFNDKGYGTISGRLQFLGMYRDYDNGNNGNASTLGGVLGYITPKWAGFDAGLAYNYAGTLFDGGNSSLVANDDINVLNEAWVRITPSTAGLADTTLLVGRKISNGEVFRADDFRQKARSIQAIQIETRDIPNTTLTVGYADKLSNWIDSGTRWEFNNFGNVFGVGYHTDGITWGEGVYTGIEKLEVALFDAYAWDVTNLLGTRVKYNAFDTTSIIFYYRHENDVGKAASQNTNAYGISLESKLSEVTVEPGYFGVRGDNLRFQETTTGINHPLGASMIIYPSMFAGGADTAYLKVTAKINKTALYALYNYTWQGNPLYNYDGQELDLVVKQPLMDNLSVAFKFGIGYRDAKNDGNNTTATDTRLFLTYVF